MRLLDRYLLRELLLPFGFCQGGFFVFWLSFDLFSKLGDFQKAKMRGLDIAAFYLFSAPEMLVIMVPVALLLGLLYALTNHARHHEITAMRAAGISIWRLATPYLATGLLLSLALFALNETVVPITHMRAEELKTRRINPGGARENEVVRNLGFVNARAGRDWQIGQFNLLSGEMRQPRVKWPLPDGTLCWLYADRAVFTNGGWAFFNVKELRQTSPQDPMLVPSLQTNFLIKPAFTETPDEIRSEVAISVGLGLKKTDPADIPLAALVGYVRLHPQLSGQSYAWVHTKLHGRLAAPWACLVVVLIAIPFGAPSGRRNVFVGVASSIFICFAYFVLLRLGFAFGSAGYVPPWLGAWLPNLVFGGTSVYLVSRVR
jgi:lipopolysaccharide export system permease protein